MQKVVIDRKQQKTDVIWDAS